MAYYFFMDGILLPVAPSKIATRIRNRNQTVHLIDDSEVNILKDAGLTEISFEAMLPNVKYPFAYYQGTFLNASHYLSKLESLKTGRQPFRFIVSRMAPAGKVLFHTNMLVSLEEYKVGEDAGNGMDCMVSIELKQYRYYGTKTVAVSSTGGAGTSSGNIRGTKKTDGNYRVRQGDTLWNIAKQSYGSGRDYNKIYEVNKDVIENTSKNNGRISSAGGWWIYPGTVLTIPAG